MSARPPLLKEAISKGKEKRVKIWALPDLAEPPSPSFLGSCGAVNREILENVTKKRNISFYWPLLMYYFFEH